MEYISNDKVLHKENLKLLFTHPILCLKEMRRRSFLHTLFNLLLSLAFLKGFLLVLMPAQTYFSYSGITPESFESLSNLFQITQTQMEAFIGSWAFRGTISFINIVFLMFLINLPTLIIWFLIWIFCRNDKYDVAWTEVANIYYVALLPLFFFEVVLTVIGFKMGVNPNIIVTGIWRSIWVMANPFMLMHFVLILLGCHYTFKLKKLQSVVVISIYIGCAGLYLL